MSSSAPVTTEAADASTAEGSLPPSQSQSQLSIDTNEASHVVPSVQSQDYISPASSATVNSWMKSNSSSSSLQNSTSSPPQQQQETQQVQQIQISPTDTAATPQMTIDATNTMTTIENSSPRNSIVSRGSDDMMNIPPVHPFFKQHAGFLPQYDSDGSDASFQRRRTSSESSITGHSRRERLSSFDSAGSPRYAPNNTTSPSATRPQSQTTSSTSTPSKKTPINPQLLPYHERRKLAKQREAQRQQQTAASTVKVPYRPGQPPPMSPMGHQLHDRAAPPLPGAPPTANLQDARSMPYFTQPPLPGPPAMYPGQPMDPRAAAAFMQVYGIPPPGMMYPHPPPPYHGYPPNMPPPGYPQHPGYPMGYYPGVSPYLPSPVPPHSKPSSQQPPIPAFIYPQSPTMGSFAEPTNSQPQEAPPNRITRRSHSTSETSKRSPRSSSAGIPQPALRKSSSNPYERQGSEGRSVSPYGQELLDKDSLGRSKDSESGISDRSPSTPREHRRKSSSGSFLDMLRQTWSSEQDSPMGASAASTVSDFHRRNQDFLMRTNPSPSNTPNKVMPKPAHQRVNSQDRPPASRGTHKRLPSITNDDWEEQEDKPKEVKNRTAQQPSSSGEVSQSSQDVLSSDLDYPYSWEKEDADERTSLLPPSGIGTSERGGDQLSSFRQDSSSRSGNLLPGYGAAFEAPTERWDNRAMNVLEQANRASHENHRRGGTGTRKKKHKRKRKAAFHRNAGDSSDDSMDSDYAYQRWKNTEARTLEKERERMVAQWREEARREAAQHRQQRGEHEWYRKFTVAVQREWDKASWCLLRGLNALEAFIANLPLTIGAIAMAIVTLGVVWFKFAEENLKSCERVQFHSSQCTFPEFPGCFYCDTHTSMYQIALGFHYGCKFAAGLLAMLFVMKVLMATRVVIDEMSSPTTASPAGLLCMTTVCVFAGRGVIGHVMVTTAASVHFGLVIWFMYIALAYNVMPDPSWFPNTVGVGLSAVKIWLYYPTAGHLLMAISLLANFFFFPISLIRVAINNKISATIGWMQMGAPAISLYALTIMAQPSFAEEHPDVTNFQRVHRMVYLPCMHVMAALSILGFLASCHSLWNRWSDFKGKEFSPAHAAFCFPVLSHANALQAYRGAIISFSTIHAHSWRMIVLYVYWFIVLIGGTLATLIITAKFLYKLPEWTNLDLSDEEEPPPPSETIIALRDVVTAGETLRQPFVSPAVLQANETGALVLTRSGPEGDARYVRTRRISALGFEVTMNPSEMMQEREVLLDWVVKHPPRRRNRTLSVPGIDFHYGARFGTGNSGVFGVSSSSSLSYEPRRRADTLSPRSHF